MAISKKLPPAIEQLAGVAEVRARHVDGLRVAAGANVSSDERALIDEKVAERFDDFTDKAKRRVVSRFVTTLPNALKLKARGQEKIDVAEASGIAPLRGGRSLVVDDARGVYLVDKDGDASRILSAKDHPELMDLEGIAVDGKEENAFVVSEGARTIYQIPLTADGDDVDAAKPIALGMLPELNDGTVNGWEGLDVVPGKFLTLDGSDGPDALVCVHEAAPTRVIFVTIPDAANSEAELPILREFKIPNSAAPHLEDLSDVAVDKESGHLLLLSDRSKTIVELKPTLESQAVGGHILEHTKLELIGITPIPDATGTKPEGIGFDPDNGQIVVSSEKGNKSRVQRFDVQRPTT